MMGWRRSAHSHRRYTAEGEDMFGKDRRGSGCRKLCFALYFIVTWSIVALVLLMIWMAPRWARSGDMQGCAGVNIV